MKINQSFSTEPRQCKTKLNLSIDPNTIKTIIPLDKLKVLQKDDPEPFYVVEEIKDITEQANGVEFTKEFWDTYLSVLDDRPIPGSKSGHNHSWGATPENDLYVIGGKIKGKKVLLKNYVPPMGATSENKSFIRDIEAGLVHFSIVSWTEDLIETDENGMVKSIKAIRSVKGERNDAIEVGMGAMKQKVNKDQNKIDPKNNNNKELEVLVMADNLYSDIVKNLQNQIENGTVSKVKVAKDLKIEVVTDDHKTAVKTLKEIEKLIGEKPVDTIKEMKADASTVKQQAYDNTREKLMVEAFGPVKQKVDGEEKENLKRQAAEPLVSVEIQKEKDLKSQIETAKENAVVKNLSFQEADITSQTNDVTGVKINKAGVNNSEFEEM